MDMIITHGFESSPTSNSKGQPRVWPIFRATSAFAFLFYFLPSFLFLFENLLIQGRIVLSVRVGNFFLNFLTVIAWTCSDANLAISCFSFPPNSWRFLFWSLSTCRHFWILSIFSTVIHSGGFFFKDGHAAVRLSSFGIFLHWKYLRVTSSQRNHWTEWQGKKNKTFEINF